MIQPKAQHSILTFYGISHVREPIRHMHSAAAEVVNLAKICQVVRMKMNKEYRANKTLYFTDTRYSCSRDKDTIRTLQEHYRLHNIMGDTLVICYIFYVLTS